VYERKEKGRAVTTSLLTLSDLYPRSEEQTQRLGIERVGELVSDDHQNAEEIRTDDRECVLAHATVGLIGLHDLEKLGQSLDLSG
jgi:hypothetical protein